MSDLKEKVAQELSSKISLLIGYHLDKDNIQHILEDGTGYHYYVQCLKPRHPLLIIHYRGPLVLMLPFEDYQRLNSEEVTVDAYIESSFFNYGYYLGGGDLLNGAYWQPLEEGVGIHNTEYISQHLHFLSCRSSRWMSRQISQECCEHCPLDGARCQYSPLNHDVSGGYILTENDDRRHLFYAVEERVQRELGFQLYSRTAHEGDRHELRLYPGDMPNTVTIGVSAELLNDLLYHPQPESTNWARMAHGLTISITKFCRPEWDMWEKWKIIIPQETECKRKICLDFWRDKVAQWEKIEAKAETEHIRAEEVASGDSTRFSADKGRLCGFIRKLFAHA